MKSLLTYISEAMGSNYEEFKSRLEDVKSKNGKGLIIQFIDDEDSANFTNEIGAYSSMVIPYNVKRSYSLMTFRGANSKTPVDKFIKTLGGELVEELTFKSSGFPHRGPSMFDVDYKYTVKVFQFNIEDATKLSEKQLKFIERPEMYFIDHSSALFGIASIDKKYIWDIVEKYL